MGAPRPPTVDIVVTTEPAPAEPLQFMGASMLEVFPYRGIVDGVGLALAVISYAGQLGFGLTGDRDLQPDLGRLAEAIEKAFRDLGGST